MEESQLTSQKADRAQLVSSDTAFLRVLRVVVLSCWRQDHCSIQFASAVLVEPSPHSSDGVGIVATALHHHETIRGSVVGPLRIECARTMPK